MLINIGNPKITDTPKWMVPIVDMRMILFEWKCGCVCHESEIFGEIMWITACDYHWERIE